MGSLVLAGATSGSTTITPTDAVTVTCTLPSTGGTLQTSGAGFTTNGVAYASSTSALATGSALTFDGTNVGIGGSPSAWGATVTPAIQLVGTGGGASISTYLGYQTFITANAYYNAGWKFISGSNPSGQYQINGNTHQWFNSTATPVSGNSTVYSQAMTLDASGNLGIGTTSPSASGVGGSPKILQIYNSGTSIAQLVLSNADTASGAYPGVISFVSSALSNADKRIAEIAATKTDASTSAPTGALTFNTSAGSGPVERARIDSSGNLLVGTTLNQGTGRISLYPTSGGTTCINTQSTASNYYVGIFYTSTSTLSGYIAVSGSATTYSTASDYRLKENIAPMTGALDKVKVLKPVTFNWIADKKETQGFIAHELQAIVPECVTGEKDAVDENGNPKYQGIDTSFLVATLTSAIQELSTLITAQQSTIQSLTERITVLENK